MVDTLAAAAPGDQTPLHLRTVKARTLDELARRQEPRRLGEARDQVQWLVAFRGVDSDPVPAPCLAKACTSRSSSAMARAISAKAHTPPTSRRRTPAPRHCRAAPSAPRGAPQAPRRSPSHPFIRKAELALVSDPRALAPSGHQRGDRERVTPSNAHDRRRPDQHIVPTGASPPSRASTPQRSPLWPDQGSTARAEGTTGQE
jgi:hypothetical protein